MEWPPLFWECLGCQVGACDLCAGGVVTCECTRPGCLRRLSEDPDAPDFPR